MQCWVSSNIPSFFYLLGTSSIPTPFPTQWWHQKLPLDSLTPWRSTLPPAEDHWFEGCPWGAVNSQKLQAIRRRGLWQPESSTQTERDTGAGSGKWKPPKSQCAGKVNESQWVGVQCWHHPLHVYELIKSLLFGCVSSRRQYKGWVFLVLGWFNQVWHVIISTHAAVIKSPYHCHHIPDLLLQQGSS